MKLCNLLSGVSLGVLAFAAFETPARAQEQLPTMDVGAAKPVAGGPGEGQGRGRNTSAGSGTGAGGYGGAGSAQDPYNKTYTYEDASVGTKTDTPIMDTPLDVVSVSQQVLKDQQITDLAEALQNVSGVTVARAGRIFQWLALSRDHDLRVWEHGQYLPRRFPGGRRRRLRPPAISQCAERRGAQRRRGDPLRAQRTGRSRQHRHQAAAGRALLCGKHSRYSLAEYRTTIDATGPLIRTSPCSIG